MFVWNQWHSQGKLWNSKRIFSLWNDWFKQSHWKSMVFPCFSYKKVWFTAFFPWKSSGFLQPGWELDLENFTRHAQRFVAGRVFCVSWWWDMAMVWGGHTISATEYCIMYISWEFMEYYFDISNIMINCNIREIMVIHGDTMGNLLEIHEDPPI